MQCGCWLKNDAFRLGTQDASPSLWLRPTSTPKAPLAPSDSEVSSRPGPTWIARCPTNERVKGDDHVSSIIPAHVFKPPCRRSRAGRETSSLRRPYRCHGTGV